MPATMVRKSRSSVEPNGTPPGVRPRKTAGFPRVTERKLIIPPPIEKESLTIPKPESYPENPIDPVNPNETGPKIKTPVYIRWEDHHSFADQGWRPVDEIFTVPTCTVETLGYLVGETDTHFHVVFSLYDDMFSGSMSILRVAVKEFKVLDIFTG